MFLSLTGLPEPRLIPNGVLVYVLSPHDCPLSISVLVQLLLFFKVLMNLVKIFSVPRGGIIQFCGSSQVNRCSGKEPGFNRKELECNWRIPVRWALFSDVGSFLKAIWNGAMYIPVLAALFFFYLTEHLFSSVKNWLREKSCFLSKLQIIVQGKIR